MGFNLSAGTISAQQAFDANHGNQGEAGAGPADGRLAALRLIEGGVAQIEQAETVVSLAAGSLEEMRRRLEQAEAEREKLARGSELSNEERCDANERLIAAVNAYGSVAEGAAFQGRPFFGGGFVIAVEGRRFELPRFGPLNGGACGRVGLEEIREQRKSVERARQELDGFNEAGLMPAVRELGVATTNLASASVSIDTGAIASPGRARRSAEVVRSRLVGGGCHEDGVE